MPDRSILKEILQLYKEFTCLWDPSHQLYTNKEAREQAYEVLLEKYKLIEEDATLDSIKKKLENMRCTYKRELKKVLSSRMRGAPEHKPSLWYYNYLTFLDQDHNKFTTIKCSNEADDTDDFNDCDNEISHNDMSRSHSNDIEEDYEYEEIYKSKKPKLSTIYIAENHEGSSNYQINENNQATTNSAEAFGRTIGLQLKELTSLQRNIAEKLISDVIFYARLNKLTTDSSINFG